MTRLTSSVVHVESLTATSSPLPRNTRWNGVSAAALSLRGIRLHQGINVLVYGGLLWNYQEQYYSGRGAETAVHLGAIYPTRRVWLLTEKKGKAIRIPIEYQISEVKHGIRK